jgi:MinD superfamily P-loop ATPase
MEKPQQIAITGGKGGTGKSTVSILLLRELLEQGKKVVLCDADVECPDDYLLLGQKLGPVEQKIFADFPKLIKEKCKKCGLCVKSCRSHAIFQAPGHYPIFIKDLCSGCGGCQLACPFGAIEMEKEVTGGIYLQEAAFSSRSDKGKKLPFSIITGQAKAGLEEVGPVVEELRKFTENFAEQNNIDVVLIDTAAGTHCPVLHALLGVEKAYVVTEATPMGAHDLDLILEVNQKLKVKSLVILNQANLGDKSKVEEVIEKYQVPLVKEIPFSKPLLTAYSQGRLLEANFSLADF